MVVNYSNAKIYKIVDNTNGCIYIGSTTQSTLAKRLTGHVAGYKLYKKGKVSFVTSYKILENGDYDMVLLETVNDCTSKDQLKARERYHIENNKCVNKVIVGRTDKEYREANKERKAHNSKEYYNKNREILRAKQNTKAVCPDCGGKYTNMHKKRHERSGKHQLSLQDIESTIPIKTKMSTTKTY